MKKMLYTTKDVIKKIGVSRNTLFLWFRHKKIPETKRNRNGHRIFTKEDIDAILSYKNRLILPENK